jgi:hypothetical protein
LHPKELLRDLGKKSFPVLKLSISSEFTNFAYVYHRADLVFEVEIENSDDNGFELWKALDSKIMDQLTQKIHPTLPGPLTSSLNNIDSPSMM